MKDLLRAISAIAVILAIVATFAVTGAGAWSMPQNISGPYGGLLPAVTVGAGAIHVAWASSDEVYYRRLDNGVWSEIVNVSRSPGVLSYEPTIAVDDLGQIYVFWVEWPNAYEAQLFFSCSPGSGIWTKPELLMKGARYPSCVYAENRLRVVWTSHPQGVLFCAEIEVKDPRLSGLDFRPEKIPLDGGAAVTAVDTDWLVFTNYGWPYEVWATHRIAGTWVTPINISQAGSHSENPHVDGGWATWSELHNGQMSVYQKNLNLSANTDKMWVAEGVSPAITVINGFPAIVYGRYPTATSGGVYFRDYDYGTHEDTIVFSGSYPGGLYPDIVCWNDSLYVVYGSSEGLFYSVSSVSQTSIVGGDEEKYQPTSRLAFKIFPNPCRDKVEMEVPPAMAGAEVAFFDLCGRLLRNEKISPGQDRRSINLKQGGGELAPGIYFLRLQWQDDCFPAMVQKLVVIR